MRQTVLHDEHAALGGRIVDFQGWALPVQYVGIVQEHLHTRSRVSLFDTCHMAEFLVRGPEGMAAFDRLVSNEMTTLAVGRCRYGAILNDSAGIVDDAIAMRLSEDELYVVTNAGPYEAVAALLKAEVPGLSDETPATAKIDVQGPGSRSVLVEVGLEAAASLRYYTVCRTQWQGCDVILSRTGYTGELGFEVYLPNDRAVALWRALLAHDGVQPAGLGARDTLRTEMGYLLSGQDFDESRTPLEAGMERFVRLDREFRGRDALVAQRDRGDYPMLTGIRTSDRRAPRHGFEIQADGRTVGIVTSGTFGPSVGYGIGLAYLPRDIRAESPKNLAAGPRGLDVEPVEVPFYTAGTFRD